MRGENRARGRQGSKGKSKKKVVGSGVLREDELLSQLAITIDNMASFRCELTWYQMLGRYRQLRQRHFWKLLRFPKVEVRE